MSRHRKPPAHHESMIARAQTQKVLTDRMVQDTVRIIRGAYADAERSIAGTVGEFIAAYRVEWETATEECTTDDEDGVGTVDVASRAAHLRHWLITSGWRNRLMHAYRSAAQTASQQSLDAILDAQRPMVETGWNHGRQLVIAAMQPAIEAGAPWRPKP